ncbi:caax 2-like prenyl protease, partial [Mytilus galloprovincialis]
LFFGVAHVHHMIEKVTTGGLDVKTACKQSLFQLTYTTLFGIYSAFLFLRTGHLIAPVIAHAFCNHMGFPSFGEVMGHPQPKTNVPYLRDKWAEGYRTFPVNITVLFCCLFCFKDGLEPR